MSHLAVLTPSAGAVEESGDLLMRVVTISHDLDEAVRQLSQLLITKQKGESKIQVPAISAIRYRSIKRSVDQLVQHLDCIQQLKLLLTGAIVTATETGQVESLHANNAIRDELQISNQEARSLHKTWNATYRPSIKSPITSEMITHIAGRNSSTNTELNPQTNTSDENPLIAGESEEVEQAQTKGQEEFAGIEIDGAACIFQGRTHAYQLTESQHRQLTQLRRLENTRRHHRHQQNLKFIESAKKSKVITTAVSNAMYEAVAKLTDESPVSQQDVIAETLTWIKSQYDDYQSSPTAKSPAKPLDGQCLSPTSNSLNITIDSVTDFVTTRVRELNRQANPANRLKAREKRYFAIGKERDDSLIPVHGLVTPETAANLTAAIEAHSQQHPNENAQQDIRTTTQKRSDAIGHMASVAAHQLRKDTHESERSPRAMLTIAAEQQDINTINDAATVIAESVRQLRDGKTMNPTKAAPIAGASLSATSSPSEEIPPRRPSEENEEKAFKHQVNDAPKIDLYRRVALDALANPPGTIHPHQRSLITRSAAQVMVQEDDKTSFDVTTPQGQQAYMLSLQLILTHTFETNTGYSLTLDEIQRLGISEYIYECGIHPEKAKIISMTSKKRSGGHLFRAIKTLEQGVCAKPGSTIGTALCELHHIKAWAYGGTTDFDNLVATSKSPHSANDDTKQNPNKGHYNTRPDNGITGWKAAENDNPTGKTLLNFQPKALRAPARRINQTRKPKPRHHASTTGSGNHRMSGSI